jgi:hypothetical protein
LVKQHRHFSGIEFLEDFQYKLAYVSGQGNQLAACLLRPKSGKEEENKRPVDIGTLERNLSICTINLEDKKEIYKVH